MSEWCILYVNTKHKKVTSCHMARFCRIVRRRGVQSCHCTILTLVTHHEEQRQRRTFEQTFEALWSRSCNNTTTIIIIRNPSGPLIAAFLLRIHKTPKHAPPRCLRTTLRNIVCRQTMVFSLRRWMGRNDHVRHCSFVCSRGHSEVSRV